MNPFVVHTLVVVGIYYTWCFHTAYLKERTHRLRERVTYMLWNAANNATQKGPADREELFAPPFDRRPNVT